MNNTFDCIFLVSLANYDHSNGNRNFRLLLLEFSRVLIWQYGLWSFQTGGIKLERFSPKNQHTQRKFLNFENWTNGEPQ